MVNVDDMDCAVAVRMSVVCWFELMTSMEFDVSEGDCVYFSSPGGQISFDVFPKGWDKTFCLRYVENDFKVSPSLSRCVANFFYVCGNFG